MEEEELNRLEQAAHIQEKLIKKERERMGIRNAELAELNRLKRAYEIHHKLAHSSSAIIRDECEYLAHCYHLQQELLRKHSIVNEECDRLLAAYHIYDSLCKNEDKALEKEELEKLVRAAEIEKKLIDLEEGRLQGDVVGELIDEQH